MYVKVIELVIDSGRLVARVQRLDEDDVRTGMKLRTPSGYDWRVIRYGYLPAEEYQRGIRVLRMNSPKGEPAPLPGERSYPRVGMVMEIIPRGV